MANIPLEKRMASCPMKPVVAKRVRPSVANSIEVNILSLNDFCDGDVPKGWYVMYVAEHSQQGLVVGRVYTTLELPQAYESLLESLSRQGYNILKGRMECPLLNQ